MPESIAAANSVDVAAVARRRRVALVGAVIAGVGTQFENVWRVAQSQAGVEPLAVPVRPYRRDWLERSARFLPASFRGTLRSVAATVPLFTASGLDAVWTQIDLPLLPWLATANAFARVPVIYTADSTPALLRSFGADYGHWGGRSALKIRLRDRIHAMCLRRADIVNPWTNWAARSMRDDYGVAPDRLVVLPPGVDLDFWHPVDRSRRCGPVRLLFVGGDFKRKGGDLLLDVWRRRLRGRAELDLVTRTTEVVDEPGLRVHRDLATNDPRLRDLYAAADVLVIPTRADCFSMAGLEGMASGLPVVTTAVGGVSELMDDGSEGYYVRPGDGSSLAYALELLVSAPLRRWFMGGAARWTAVQRYDASKNAARLLDFVQRAAPR